MLISPALKEKTRAVFPEIERRGQPFRADRFQGARFEGVGRDRPKQVIIVLSLLIFLCRVVVERGRVARFILEAF